MGNISVTPQGQIYLCKTPLVSDYKHQLTFSNLQAQLSYFNSKIEKTFDNYTYIKHDNMIKVGENIDNIINCNYLFYKNTGFTNKYYFCFITNMEYINENCTAIYFTTDVFQTWQFDINYHPCFVEREHVNDDTIGAHTVEENLNVGEVIEESETTDSSYTNEYGYFIGIMSGYTPADGQSRGGKNYDGISVLNNVVSGLDLFLFKITDRASIFNVLYFLARTNDDGKINDIGNMFIIPNVSINEARLSLHTFPYVYGGVTLGTCNYYTIPPASDDVVFNPTTFNTTITKRHSFTGFTPKNNKCFVYPYNYLYVSNNQGSDNIFKYEDFSGSNCVFENQIAVSIGISGRIVPKNYRGKSYDYDESITLGKYPTCGWSGDAFTNWLTANAVNIPSQIVGNVIGSVTQFASGNVIGGLTNIAGTIAGMIGEFHKASLLPNIKGGQTQGDISFSANSMGFTFREMRAKTEFLQVIDNYFSMFGYKINTVKSPNITGRNNWNYVKTTNANFTGNIPQSDILQINNMFNNGVTLWHNPNNMYNYSSNNSIV